MARVVRKLYNLLSGLRSDSRGNIAVITALMLPILVGFIGLGIDTANWYSNHRQLDRIAETAAVAAAPYLSSDTTAQVTAVAENVAALNGLSTSKGDTISVAIGSNPSSVTVTATRTLTRFFSALILTSNPVTSASATAISNTNQVCVLVLGSGSQALTVDSGASLNAPNCEIDVASTNSNAAVFNASLPNVAKVCVAGGSTVGSGVTVNNLTNNCTTATNTYSLPTPTVGSCNVNGAVYGPGSVTLNPGVYCGNFNWNGPGTLTLNPGLYILDGGVNWTLSENWTINGSGVTFYLVNEDSYLDFNGQATVNITPPTSGTYANILMFEPNGLSGGTGGCTGDGCFNLTAQTSGNTLQGLIYLPSRNIYVQATALSSSSGLTLVANTVTFYQTMSWTLSPNTTNGLTNSNGTGTLTN